MMLRLHQIDERSSPVGLDWDLAASPWPRGHHVLERVIAAVESLAVRLVPPSGELPSAGPHTALTPWGRVEVPQGVPRDVLRVYVGPATSPNLGEGGPVGYQGGPFARWPGVSIALGPDANWAAYDAGGVAAHELLHGIGVGHVSDTRALMHAVAVPGAAKRLTPPDVAAIHATGWRLAESPTDSTVKAHLDGGGHILLKLETAAEWYAEGRFQSYDLLPPGTPALL